MNNRPILIAFISFLQIGTLFSQEIEWQNTIGGSGSDVLYFIEQTQDKGFICGGYSDSGISGDKTEASQGVTDYWIVKLDTEGNIQWQNTIGGNSYDFLRIIHQTADSGYVCGGFSNSDSTGDKTEDTYEGSHDFWIIKLDNTGNIQWQQTIGGDSADFLYSMELTSDGGFVCGGSSKSEISGNKTENCQGGFDYWVVKFDNAGNIEWQNTIGGNDHDYLYAIHETSDGGYICGGQSESNISGDKTENTMGSGDIDFWVVKLDSTGSIEWQNTIGGDYFEVLYSINQTSDGGYIAGGWSSSDISGDKTEVGLGYHDFWIIKLDATGNIIWQNTIGGADHEEIISLIQTNDGGYMCSGHSNSYFSGDKTEDCLGEWDFWLMKMDSSGNQQWQNTVGGNDYDGLRSLVQISDGSYVAGGFSQSDISGDKTENCQGDDDFWIVKLTSKFNHIKGLEFADLNSNNIFDTSETPISNKKITETNTGRFAFTNNAGNYSLLVLDSGYYQVTIDPLLYFNVVPVSYSVYFNDIQQINSPNDFALQPAGTFNDLCVDINPIGPFRNGMDASYILNYINQGTTTLSPVVVFYPDTNITFISSNPSPSIITSDSLVYSFGSLNPYESGQILIVVSVNTGLAIGTLINSHAAILPISNDANPACNIDYWEVFVVGSLDPNDMLVNRNTLFDYELTTPPWLEYIIRFQNTGNDTAFYVRVDNKIAPELQLNSFEFLSSSHPCTIEYQSYDSLMKFTFNNILLPDSNMNEPESHGFVRYRIKPQGNLAVGDTISNNAGIYFDYNAPVWTNEAITEIISSLGIAAEAAAGTLKVYPNPVNDELTIELINTKPQYTIIGLYNIFGRHIADLYHGNINQGRWNKTFDVSELSSGMYLMKVSGTDFYTARFIKM